MFFSISLMAADDLAKGKTVMLIVLFCPLCEVSTLETVTKESTASSLCKRSPIKRRINSLIFCKRLSFINLETRNSRFKLQDTSFKIIILDIFSLPQTQLKYRRPQPQRCFQ